MGAETAGRKLGIGLRLAARAARAGIDTATAASSNRPSPPRASQGTAKSAPSAQVAAKARALGQGTKRFGEAVIGPMAHTGGVLWLEITGLFFALFAVFFAQNVYKFRYAYKSGPDHAHFLIYAAFTLVFVWFAFFNFFKARRKEKKNRARRAALSRS